nr:M6 family metalloprotease domain-containing protein [Bacilli bacterium]
MRAVFPYTGIVLLLIVAMVILPRDSVAMAMPKKSFQGSMLPIDEMTPFDHQAVRMLSPLHMPLRLPVQSQSKLLVVAVLFQGQKAQIPLSTIYKTYFAKHHSVASYFRDVSYGNFQLSGNVIGDPNKFGEYLQLPHRESYYAGLGNGDGSPFPHNDDGIVHDTLQKLIQDHFDFSPYVVSGVLPYLAIVFGGYGADVDPSNQQLIWPVENTLNQSMRIAYRSINPSQKGVKASSGELAYAKVSSYDIVPALADESGLPSTMGVYTHEFGHVLGLDDLYDTSGSENTTATDVGSFSLMALGNWNGDPQGQEPAFLDPISQMVLGWLHPQIMTASVTNLIVPPIEQNAIAYAFMPSTNHSPFYFVLDNVQPLSYDVGQPQYGLMLWRVLASEVKLSSKDWQNNVLNAPSLNASRQQDVALYRSYTGQSISTFAKLGFRLTDIREISSKNMVVNVLQQGSGTLTIDEPVAALEGAIVKNHQSIPLFDHFQVGDQRFNVTRASKWIPMTGNVKLEGNVAHFNGSGKAIVSSYYHNKTAYIEFLVTS